MNYNLSHITTNPIVLTSAVLASIGWLVTFVGACITHLHGASWWIIVYELGLIIAIYMILTRSLFKQYQLVLLIMLAISIAMLTQLIEMFVHRSDQASQASAAGSCMLIIMQYLWVFVFGSSEESAIHRSIYGMANASQPLVSQAHFVSGSHRTVSMQSVNTTASSYHQPKHQQPSIQSITPVQQPMISAPRVTSSAPIKVTTPSDAPDTAAKKDEARALHGYRANADDPNELSFEKDEVLEIIDKRGNWWQAKKKDGTVGIVPSNYVSASYTPLQNINGLTLALEQFTP